MKAAPPRNKTKVTTVEAPGSTRWLYVVAAAVASLILLFIAYGPAMNGPFLFDDSNLIYALPAFRSPLGVWLRVDVRPVLFFTYWVSSRLGQNDPYWFHFVNVWIHLINGALVYLIVRRLLRFANIERNAAVLSAFAASVFLLHPVQAEAVAYVAGRSESLFAMFGLAAFALFLYRKQSAASWSVVAGVFVFFGLALLSKQNAIALPALLLLTDFWWNPGDSFSGIRANWKLYVPMVLGAVAGVAFFWRMLTTAETAGFGMKDLPWYQYFFTQCRALFVYLGMFLLPVNLNADWDFSISRTVIDHGAIVGLVVLLALVAAAWQYRRRFPLATYGFFVFLVMMAPTSSFLPIKDPIAERRLYFAILGLLLIVVDLLGRIRIERRLLPAGCVLVVIALTAATHARAAVWSDPIALWEDTARKSPNKRRVRFQLAYAYFSSVPPQYDRALPEFEKSAQIEPPDHNLLVDWALALDGLNRMDEAIAKLRQAAMLLPTAHVYSQIGAVYGHNGKWPEALEALNTAEKIDPKFAKTYAYRGKVFVKTGRCQDAIVEFQHALTLAPDDQESFKDMLIAQQMLQRGCPVQ